MVQGSMDEVIFLFSELIKHSFDRKDHVVREHQSNKKWQEKWGYLLDEYEKVTALNCALPGFYSLVNTNFLIANYFHSFKKIH